MKSNKLIPRTLKGVLVGYNGYIIYWVYIKDEKKVIRVKNFYFFEDYKIKASIELSDYNNDKPTFQNFLSKNNNEEK